MAYDGQCGSCENFQEAGSNQLYDDKHNSSLVKGYCTWYHCYYYPDDKCDSHYKEKPRNSDCFITTVVCTRLGLDDDCHELQVLRDFRNRVLQRDEKYKGLLFEYDTIGPKIAAQLVPEDEEVIQKIQKSYLLPIVGMIEAGKNDEAIQKYQFLTRMLQHHYGIEGSGKATDDYDYRSGGHGFFKRRGE